MSQRRLFSILLCLQLLFLVIQAKNISLDIFFRRYRNKEHHDRDGICCTGGRSRCIGDCTSTIKFCLQSQGIGETSCPHGELTFTIFSDDLMFSADGQIGTNKFMRNISNPISFQVNPGRYQIYIDVRNAMSNSTILIFRRNVNIQARDIGFMSKDIWSTCRKVQYSYRIGCAWTYYGPDCSTFCTLVNDSTGHFKCDLNGKRVCLPGFTNSSESDERCTECIPGSQNVACHELGTIILESTSGVSVGEVAGILISLLFILACVLGGITAGLLWKFKPWISNSTINTKAPDAMNNPIYGCNEDNKAALSNPIYGENRDITWNGAEDQSNPLYSSKEYLEEDSVAVMEQSGFIQNELLENILQHKTGDVPPTVSPSLEEGTGVGQDPSDVPRMDPYLSYKDEFLSEYATDGVHQ